MIQNLSLVIIKEIIYIFLSISTDIFYKVLSDANLLLLVLILFKITQMFASIWPRGAKTNSATIVPDTLADYFYLVVVFIKTSAGVKWADEGGGFLKEQTLNRSLEFALLNKYKKSYNSHNEDTMSAFFLLGK